MRKLVFLVVGLVVASASGLIAHRSGATTLRHRALAGSRFGRKAPHRARRVAETAVVAPAATATTTVLPAGFQESIVFSGLTEPTSIQFSPDGRVFVAEKSGLVKVFQSLTATTPTVFADLRTNVHNFYDRGLGAIALHPDFPHTPYVYVVYTLDAPIGGTPPVWGSPGATSDGCPTPPGPTTGGCVVGGRLSRLTAAGNVMTGSENVLIENWCQQFPSHSQDGLVFGSDGALYMSAGDGASFQFVDYGQNGNPCGDPPGGPGSTESPPSAEGGALRAQDLLTVGGPVGRFNGSILRVDPMTGAAMPDNPLAGTGNPDDRVIAHGLRNPWRITVRPGTREIWIGDVGFKNVEEIDRIDDPTAPVKNFGWPCYEGPAPQSGYKAANLDLCNVLYANPNAVTPPYFSYKHTDPVVAGESCPTGSSSITGLAFYQSGSYPAAYGGALFFADYSRNCVWVMFKGSNGLPDPATRQTFAAGAGSPVDLEIGPGGDLFYVDVTGGTIRRITGPQNDTPTAAIAATPQSGPVPLHVAFDGTGSRDPNGGALSYSWDFGSGQFGASTAARPEHDFTAPGVYTVRLRVTDMQGLSDTAQTAITAGTPPTATIAAPTSSTTWAVGDVIAFSGSAADAAGHALPASALTWSLVLHHCPSNCHLHFLQTFAGVDHGQFAAPDHEYPSWLELQLTATDANGLSGTTSVTLQPRTVALSFTSSPSGLTLGFDANSEVTPFTETVIARSAHSVSAPPQLVGGTQYGFVRWSDGGAASHNIVTGDMAGSFAATFAPTSGTPSLTFAPVADTYVDSTFPTSNFGTSPVLWADAARPEERFFLRFKVGGIGAGTVQQAKVRLTVGPSGTAASASGGTLRGVSDGIWAETAPTWNTQPAIDGPSFGTLGAVAKNQVVEFDVTSLVTGDGTYSFGLTSDSSDGVQYQSREAASGPPQLVVQLRPSSGATTTTSSTSSSTTTQPSTSTTSTTRVTTTSTSSTAPLATTTSTTSAVTTTTAPGASLVFGAVADTYVDSDLPTSNFGTGTALWADGARPVQQLFLRFTVTGVGPNGVLSAKVRLTVGSSGTAISASGGTLARFSNVTWSETGTTWNNRPTIDGPSFGTIGAVDRSQVVEFDVSSVVTGNGTYSFALTSANSDGVQYQSREAPTGAPKLVVTPR